MWCGGGSATVVGMQLHRPTDRHLAALRTLTGLRRRDQLLELARITEDVLETDAGAPLLVDWIGSGYAVAVVRGTVVRAGGAVHSSGEVFVTEPFETVQSLGAVALIAQSAHAAQLAALLAGRVTVDNLAALPTPLELAPATSS
jgi:hypothetical protein